jgi:hypothetical protein
MLPKIDLVKNLLPAFTLACLFASSVTAAPPRCTTFERNGVAFQRCERDDANCDSLAKTENDESKRNGCAPVATITKWQTYDSTVGLTFVIHVVLVPSLPDSDRMDVKVEVEQTDHSYRTYVKKAVRINRKDSVPHAAIDILSLDDPASVPTVDATEKGAGREQIHSYK